MALKEYFISYSDTAEELGLKSPYQLRALIKSGELPKPVRAIGSDARLYFVRDDIKEYKLKRKNNEQ